MTRQRRTFSPEFKQQATCLVLDQGYSHMEASRSVSRDSRNFASRERPLPMALCSPRSKQQGFDRQITRPAGSFHESAKAPAAIQRYCA